MSTLTAASELIKPSGFSKRSSNRLRLLSGSWSFANLIFDFLGVVFFQRAFVLILLTRLTRLVFRKMKSLINRAKTPHPGIEILSDGLISYTAASDSLAAIAASLFNCSLCIPRSVIEKLATYKLVNTLLIYPYCQNFDEKHRPRVLRTQFGQQTFRDIADKLIRTRVILNNIRHL